MTGDFLIGIFKLVKATILFAVAGGALSLLDSSIADRAQHFVTQLTGDAHFRIVRRMASYLGVPTRRRLEFIIFACLFYGVIFSVQGIGLLYAKRWAEYFTAIATASLVPLEIYELLKRAGRFKVAVLVINVAVVVYLALQLSRTL